MEKRDAAPADDSSLSFFSFTSLLGNVLRLAKHKTFFLRAQRRFLHSKDKRRKPLSKHGLTTTYLAIVLEGARFSTLTGSTGLFAICSLSPETRLAHDLESLLIRKPSNEKKKSGTFVHTFFIILFLVVSAREVACNKGVPDFSIGRSCWIQPIFPPTLHNRTQTKLKQTNQHRHERGAASSLLLRQSSKQHVQIGQISSLRLTIEKRDLFS